MTAPINTLEGLPENWNEAIASLPNASILQTAEWAALKAGGGWQPLFRQWRDVSGQLEAAALILKKRLAPGLSFWYIPRGPLLDWRNEPLRSRVLNDLSAQARRDGTVFIKIDPDVPTEFGLPGEPEWRENPGGQALLREYMARGWRRSPQQIQFANSVWLDLDKPEEDILANMKQRTRYKVRLAEKKGVSVRHGTAADFELLYGIYAETSKRDGFLIREKSYYLELWNRFYAAGMLRPLIAEVENDTVGGLMLFIYAKKAWYIHGMSRDLHREKMPNYLLQWEAIKTARAAGADCYDLWGAPDIFDESDRMWGVYQFKRGLGGYEVITPGAWDLPIKRSAYALFVHALPRVQRLLRRLRGQP